jgi:hypothetical protein
MKVEPITVEMVDGLIASLTPIQVMVSGLNDVDITKGRGVLDESGRKHCMWTKDGKRITVEVSRDGGILVSLAKDVDPEIPV